MIIVEIINITIQLRLIVRAIIKEVVNMGVFYNMIIIIIFANIRVIFMTKVVIILLLLLSITLLDNLLL